MTKQEEVEDLILTPMPPAVKVNRHVTIAISHMNKQHQSLTLKIEKLMKERDDLEVALNALGG